jgi:hypothetical protein
VWTIPAVISPDILDFARNLDCNWVGAINVQSQAAYEFDDCHNSVLNYISIYGGKQVKCFYFVEGHGDIQSIKHSIVDLEGQLLDIMPYKDNREFNIIGVIKETENNTRSNYYYRSLAKYNKQEEVELMYYVYQLEDPRNKQPFYIGKGTGNRAKTHLFATGTCDNLYKQNKINAIREDGFEPIIEYIAENIVDEQLAYDIERNMIARYGRKGYDINGILTNVCPDNRPPNHKGKTYEEIYGPEKAKEQRKLRSRLQKERGGYGPSKHSVETRKKFSELNTGSGNPMYGKEHTISAKKLIGEANKKYTGRLNKKSKCYLLTSPSGTTHILWGKEASDFCKELNLSWSTLKMQVQKAQWPIPKKGKTKGWKLEVTNKSSLKQDVDDETFGGLSL